MSAYRSFLITGGAGFIGSHLAERLAETGGKVTVLDTAAVRQDHVTDQRIRHVRGSVTDRQLVDRLVEEHDCIFHLAALLGVKRTMDQPAEMIENNLLGTIHVLQAALKHKKRVVFASSSEVYGKSPPPFSEQSDHLYGPTSKMRWSYATAKFLEEFLCLGYVKKGAKVSVVRYFNVYGPRQKSGLYGGAIPKFIKAALRGEDITVYGDGSQTRCFTFITDAVEATIAAAGDQAVGEIINIGNDEEVAISDLAQMIKDISNSPSQIVNVPFEQVYPEGFEEIPRRLPDTSKMRSLLKVHPQTGLRQGLLFTVRWYRNEESAVCAEGGR